MKVIKLSEHLLICHECHEIEKTVVNITDAYRNLCKACIERALELFNENKNT